jgi:hypothetical protein
MRPIATRVKIVPDPHCSQTRLKLKDIVGRCPPIRYVLQLAIGRRSLAAVCMQNKYMLHAHSGTSTGTGTGTHELAPKRTHNGHADAGWPMYIQSVSTTYTSNIHMSNVTLYRSLKQLDEANEKPGGSLPG